MRFPPLIQDWQPSGPVEIDRDNSLSRWLLFAEHPFSRPRPLTRAIGNGGLHWNGGQATAASAPILTAATLTVLALRKQNTSTFRQNWAVSVGSLGSNTPSLAVGTNGTNNNRSVIGRSFSVGSTSLAPQTGATLLPAVNRGLIVLSARYVASGSTSTNTIFCDGREVASATSASDGSGIRAASIVVGTCDNGTNSQNDLVPLGFYLHAAGLTNAEIQALHANFWQLYRPARQIWVPVSASGGGGGALAAGAQAIVTASAALTTQITLAASAAATAGATAVLTTAISLQATPTSTASATAGLSTATRLSAAAQAKATASADLTAPSSGLAAAAQARATASADLSTAIRLAASAQSSAAASASLATAIPLAAAAIAQAQASAGLTTAIGLQAAAQARATASAALSGTAASLEAAAAAVASATANLSTAIRLEASARAVASAVAVLTTLGGLPVSIREQIIQQIEASLAGCPGVAGRVFRSRDDALTRDESPSIVIEPQFDSTSADFLPFLERRLRVLVSVYARASGGLPPDRIADYPALSAYQRMMADPGRSGLALDTIAGEAEYQTESADQPAAWLSQTFEVLYRHQREDMTA